MTEKPLISVIIPAHNNKGTIETAIDSIAKQTYQNLEIIVIDDNSTDGTREKVLSLTEKYKNLSYYSLPFDDPNRYNKRGRNINAGYSSRNFGFEKARGEWITFQDADDASLLNRIETEYELAQKHGLIHVCADWQKLEPSYLGKKLDTELFTTERGLIKTGPEELSALARKTKGVAYSLSKKLSSIVPFELKRFPVINHFFFGSLAPYPGAGNSPLFKREVLEKVKFRPLSKRVWPTFVGRGADRDFNFQVAETFGKSAVFKLPLYMWRVKEQNKGYENCGKYIK